MNAPVSSAEAAALRPFVPAAFVEAELAVRRGLDDCLNKQKCVRVELAAAREDARKAIQAKNRLQKQYDALGSECSRFIDKWEAASLSGWQAAREAMAEAARTVESGRGGAR